MQKKQTLTLNIVIGIIAAALGSWLAEEFLFSTPKFDDQLMTISEELNKSCPFMVDSETRLDNSIGGPGKHFSYFYTLVNYSSDQIDLKSLVDYIRPNLVNMMMTNPDMRTFKDNNVTMNYTYKDKDGVFITKIVIKPEDYNK